MPYNPVNKINLTEADKQFILANFHSMTNRQLADALGYRLTWLRTKCYEMGLKRMELEYWTPEQVEYLANHYRFIGDTELAMNFSQKWHKAKGWSKKHIEKKRRYLKLKRTAEEKRLILLRNIENGMFAMCPVKAWETRGGPAKNGTVRLWNFNRTHQVSVIKTDQGWVHHARWLYAQLHGNIPSGHVVRLKDCNQHNVVPENLMLISRGENAIMNQGRYMM